MQDKPNENTPKVSASSLPNKETNGNFKPENPGFFMYLVCAGGGWFIILSLAFQLLLGLEPAADLTRGLSKSVVLMIVAAISPIFLLLSVIFAAWQELGAKSWKNSVKLSIFAHIIIAPVLVLTMTILIHKLVLPISVVNAVF